ncbi:MAG: RNB domain-containing ribonuclease [Burkholderiaceae bacterium]
MYALFEESGKFLAGRVMSTTDASAQIELDSGKRVKVKMAHVMVQFEKPAPAELISGAQKIQSTIDPALAWEFSPEEEFGFADLASDYFNDKPTVEQQVAALFCLFETPHYFRRAGKGRFKKAPTEIVQLALLAIEKKKQQLLQISEWAISLGNGICPEPIRDQLYKILFKPDKNAGEYKAVVEAARNTKLPPLDLLQQAGAITSPYQFHWQRFLFDNFPKGIAFPALNAPLIADELPLATVAAFSIDDSATTEIDDALSVQGLGTGKVVVGIHIAAPALAILPNSDIDKVARNRLSTVYMPGNKITMLPDAVVQNYTLAEGKNCPAVSLYVTFDEMSFDIISTESKIESVPIVANLRHDTLEDVITEAWLESSGNRALNGIQPAYLLPESLSFLYQLAKNLKQKREVVRGKPETFNRPDYNFKLIDKNNTGPHGEEVVEITTRKRGSPLDLIVAEAMILANSTWGQLLAEYGVPGIYRSQASLAPGVKVRMGTKALPHAGIGVPSYAWSTSPLRRYTDMVNQWQIISCIKHGKTALLAAPFKPKDADLFSIISNFDNTYSAYNQYQNGMERYWTLKYLQQNNITELNATLFKENMVRADDLPLVLPVLGANNLDRNAKVVVKLGDINLMTLEVSGTIIDIRVAENTGDMNMTDANEDESEDESEEIGVLSIAVDLVDVVDAESTETELAAK